VRYRLTRSTLSCAIRGHQNKTVKDNREFSGQEIILDLAFELRWFTYSSYVMKFCRDVSQKEFAMKIKTIPLLFLIPAGLVIGCSEDRNARQPVEPSAAVAPDNSGRNVRDRGDETKTPMDQSESEADRTITQNIRRALTADDSLSTNAKNVKIITNDGTVTLRGPVKSEKEKADIEAKAKQVAGVKQVDNQLEVAS
jgi:hypothetical protein